MGTITIINPKPYELQPIPTVGKEYHIFDDGKINPSRHGITTIVEVIPFNEADDEILKAWCQDVAECYWLYASETDYFIKSEYDDGDEPSYFVRTTDGGWFSLGWFGARLDIDNSLYNEMIKRYSEEQINESKIYIRLS